MLEKQPMRTYNLWHELSRFKEVRTYMLHDLLTDGTIAIIAQGFYASRKRHWYYLTRKLPKEMFVLMVPYTESAEKRTLKAAENNE